MEPLLLQLSSVPASGLVLLVILAIMRPLGLLFGFLLFTWAIGQARTIKISLAFAFGVPMLVPSLSSATDLIEARQYQLFVILLPKEFFIGYALGFVASLPLVALQYAGALVDSARGENSPETPDPAGGTIGTWGALFFVFGGAIFVTSGGLADLFQVLFASYTHWPTMTIVPEIAQDGPFALASAITDSLITAIMVSSPILLLFAAVYICVGIASRIAAKFELVSSEFLVKNLVAVSALPVFIATLVYYFERLPFDAYESWELIEGILG